MTSEIQRNVQTVDIFPCRNVMSINISPVVEDS